MIRLFSDGRCFLSCAPGAVLGTKISALGYAKTARTKFAYRSAKAFVQLCQFVHYAGPTFNQHGIKNMSVLLIGGSPSPQSGTTRLLHHIGERLASHGHQCARLQVRDLPPQALLHADCADPAIVRALAQVAAADAVIVATPIYKASYTGVLKAFLDLLPQDGLRGKLVLPLATGGSQSHLLALDYALRPVLASLDARFILPSVFATSAQVAWSAEQGLQLEAAIAARVARAVEQLSLELFALSPRRPHVRTPLTAIA
jgi:FMN reductase